MKMKPIKILTKERVKSAMLLFLVFVSASVVAQEHRPDNFTRQFTFAFGESMQKFDGLNDRIAKFPQYKSLPHYATTFGLGMLTEHGRILSDINLMAGSSFSDVDKKGSVIRFVAANIGVGYDLLSEKRMLLYPIVGLGLEGLQARFYRDNSSVPFDSLLQVPSAQSSLHSLDFTNYFFTYRLGFGFSIKSAKQPFGSIGLRAVYTGSFVEHAWRTNQRQSLEDVPEDRLSQYHIALIFGKQGNSMKH
jgi:hypothetical protein